MSAGNGNLSARPVKRRKKAFDKIDFDSLHESVGGLDFTPDFNPSLEAIVVDDSRSLTERLLALVKLQAWGNQKLFAVHDDHRTRPYTRADACERLGRSTTRVHEAAEKLVRRFLLRIEGGRLYPVADPAAERERESDNSSPPGSDFSSPNLRHWLEAHPHDATAYQEAFEVIESIKKRFRADTQTSGTGGKNASLVPGRGGVKIRAGGEDFDGTGGNSKAASLNRSLEVLEEALPTSSSSSPSSVLEAEPEPENPTTTTITDPKEAEAILRVGAALRRYGTPEPDWIVRVWQSAKAKDPTVTPEEVCSLIHEKAPGRNKPGFAYFVTAVTNGLPLARDTKLQRATSTFTPDDPALQRWRAEQLATLADPNVSEQEKHLIRLCLGMEPPQ